MRQTAHLFLLLTVLFFCLPASGQKKDSFFRDLDAFFEMRAQKNRARMDTNYVDSYDYRWDGSTFVNSTGLHFVSSFGNSLLSTGMVQRVGVGVSYRGLGLSYSFVVGKKHNSNFTTDIYGKHVGVEFGFQSATKPYGNIDSAYLRYDENGRIENVRLLSSRVTVLYSFNSRFSMDAAMKQSIIQRRSAGSVIAGLTWAAWDMLFLGDEETDPVASFFKANYFYQRFSLGAGYGYNLVFGQKHWLLHLSLIPMWTFYEMQGWWESGKRETDSYPFGYITYTGTARTAVCFLWGKRWSLGLDGMINQGSSANRFSSKAPDYRRFGAQDWKIDLSLVCRF